MEGRQYGVWCYAPRTKLNLKVDIGVFLLILEEFDSFLTFSKRIGFGDGDKHDNACTLSLCNPIRLPGFAHA